MVNRERQPIGDQDIYNLGYENPAKPSRHFEWRHLVQVNAYHCRQMDRQNQQPRNTEYRREDYDQVTGDRIPTMFETGETCVDCMGIGYSNHPDSREICHTCGGSGGTHTGPICKGCGIEFYYDYIPERHDGSGYCWICFDDHKKQVEDEINRAVADLGRR